MLKGKIDTINDYKGMHKGLDVLIDYINKTNLNDLPFGLTIIDENLDISVNKLRYFGKKEPTGQVERHLNHFDMQIMLQGQEICYFDYYHEDLENYKTMEYNEAKDVIKYKANCKNTLVLCADEFSMFMPTDIHAPGNFIDETEIIKCVFKVRIK